MNIRLETLFDTYNLGHKDRYEITQIYQFLPPHKRQSLIDNFDTIVLKLQRLSQDNLKEQEILLGEALENIEQEISRVKKKQIHRSTGDVLLDFKNKI